VGVSISTGAGSVGGVSRRFMGWGAEQTDEEEGVLPTRADGHKLLVGTACAGEGAVVFTEDWVAGFRSMYLSGETDTTPDRTALVRGYASCD
jgi:hypothetical protein